MSVFFNVYAAPITAFAGCVQQVNSTESALQCALADPFSLNLSLLGAVTVFVFLASLVTNNDSWVDRFWSIYPVVSSWIFAVFRGLKEQAANPTAPKCAWCAFFKCPNWFSPQVLFCALITLWGIRLTFNFYRRGGYKVGGEDYRWLYVRSWPVIKYRVAWIPFSLVVVSLYQIALLFTITVPISQLPGDVSAKCGDYMMMALFLFFLTLEAVADQQQWDFHQYKYGKRRPVPAGIAADCKRGFMTHGLFSLSRHPNVFSEQSIWVVVFLSTLPYVGVTGSCLGASGLIYLTLGSTLLTESISTSKYPLYRKYQKITPFLYPSLVSTRAYIDGFVFETHTVEVMPPLKTASAIAAANPVVPRASGAASPSPSPSVAKRSTSAKRK